jgi:hypothetical protein
MPPEELIVATAVFVEVHKPLLTVLLKWVVAPEQSTVLPAIAVGAGLTVTVAERAHPPGKV